MSVVYYPSCPDTITAPLCTPCPAKELGRVRSIVLKKKTFSFTDITDTQEWYDAICNEDIYVIPKTRGSVAVSEVTTEGFGDTSEEVDSYDYVLSGFDPNYTQNGDFWKSIRKHRDFEVIYRTETKLHQSSNTVSVSAMNPVEDDPDSKVLWAISIKWSQEDPVLPLDMPTDVFDRCVQCA